MRRSKRFVTERAAASDRSSSAFIRRATCSARRRSESPVRKACGWSPETTSAPPDPTCDAFRAGPLRHVHHRIDLRSADLSLGPHRRRHRRHRGLVAAQRRERQDLGAVLLHDRQGAATPVGAGARHRSAGARPRHDGRHDRGLSDRRHTDAAREGRHRAAARHVVRRRAGAGAAVGPRHTLDAAARRSLRRLRLRPHARPRRSSSARVRSRLRPLRSRRLARTARDDRRDRRSSILATHGHAAPLARHLSESGLETGVIRTAWEGEMGEGE